ncbi:MAG: GNAT family N-acetyltransferase [Saprospiraceae bacterium]
MEIKIRKAAVSDFAAIFSLIHELSVFEKTPYKLTNSLERMIKEENYFHAFVAINTDDEIIGYATYNIVYYTWVGKSIYMDDLYVKSAYRGVGAGSKLIQHVIDFAKESGFHKVRWQVSEWNTPAIAFYKKLGAEIDAVEKNCDLILSK